MRRFGDRDRLGPWIHEFVADRVARIEPRFHRLRQAGRSLGKQDERLVGRLQSLIGDSENRGVDLLLVLVEDLHDVAIAAEIRQLERVSPGRQRRARHLHGPAEGEERLLVPFVGASAGRK